MVHLRTLALLPIVLLVLAIGVTSAPVPETISLSSTGLPQARSLQARADPPANFPAELLRELRTLRQNEAAMSASIQRARTLANHLDANPDALAQLEQVFNVPGVFRLPSVGQLRELIQAQAGELAHIRRRISNIQTELARHRL
ncbi:hypothetical protein A4X06_0g5475 [Tilletia controversa]|uniref:Biogenesis of lysosome-related organelles complex 1 subunit 7 n=2 Tax=Tilletia TaxID=13289 RepID=A0A8X7SW45_9BASI|nr:hypothetical protein CF336_g2364 [Tilletia laevis]KAE8200305.1 hypothetical protein CF328_g3007 [Tilletia controversa]KAE8245710.1 hypothetical protein A4X06_0g5475 [Tilletia controversa]KAE8258793.1 hypothetical protein A4X03_0g4280 [Tilletia caries]